METYIFFVIITIIVCVLLALVVLVQNPKGGGLDASFGGVSNNTFGAKRTTDFLEKATWYLAITLVVLSIGSALFIRSYDGGSNNDLINTQPAPQNNVEEGEQEGDSRFNIEDVTSGSEDEGENSSVPEETNEPE